MIHNMKNEKNNVWIVLVEPKEYSKEQDDILINIDKLLESTNEEIRCKLCDGSLYRGKGRTKWYEYLDLPFLLQLEIW